ncbi:MAG: NADH-quinone oxidoreductase subunit A [Coriobacteriaceae bacterium]|nr:NADH-quinone oxidoreductase subunit A [Coriobacteriaceae bacterium]
MQGASGQSVLLVTGLALAGVGFVGLVFLANALLSPRRPTAEKGEPYECGMPQAGPPWARVHIRFAAIALLFVLFDAETALLFAVASRLRGSLVGVIEVGAFAALLALGLAYAWRKGALEWPS